MSENDNTRATVDAWQVLLDAVPNATRQRVGRLVAEHALALSNQFYDRLLADPDAHQLLDNEVVNRRLLASMANWLRLLFEPGAPLPDLVAMQRRTGEVHARIGVSIVLIGRGARTLKHGITDLLAARDYAPRQLADAIRYAYDLLDLAVAAMNEAYAVNVSRIERSDEAYRLLFLGQDLRAERERQRTQLLEWAQQILVRYFWNFQGEPPAGGLGFTHSQFGLWLQHKAAMLFEGAPEMEAIRASIDTIEQQLLPALTRCRTAPDQAGPVVAQIQQLVDGIKNMLGTMFDRYIETQEGRDSLTRLLSRRYLPAVARREITLAGTQPDRFALLMVDIDHFARLREAPGADAAERALVQVADCLFDGVRAGDFVFRLSDDRFAVLLVDLGSAQALVVADELRQRVQSLPLRTAGPVSIFVTVSVGVAGHDGHPDYQRLIDRAEAALLQAKRAGRNRCQLAGAGPDAPGD